MIIIENSISIYLGAIFSIILIAYYNDYFFTLLYFIFEFTLVRKIDFNDEYFNTSALYELTEFLVRRYEEPSPFEKMEAIDLERSFRNKLKNINTDNHCMTLSLYLYYLISPNK